MQDTQQPIKLTGLPITELQRLLEETNAAIAERRVEELKVLADGYAKKLAMNGFSIREGMDALKPYLRIKNVMPRSGE
jgi:DNA-binding protein H-NS